MNRIFENIIHLKLPAYQTRYFSKKIDWKSLGSAETSTFDVGIYIRRLEGCARHKNIRLAKHIQQELRAEGHVPGINFQNCFLKVTTIEAKNNHGFKFSLFVPFSFLSQTVRETMTTKFCSIIQVFSLHQSWVFRPTKRVSCRRF